MPNQIPDFEAPGGLLLSRKLSGCLCLGIAMAWLLAFAVMIAERSARELIEIRGTIAQVDAGRSVRQGGGALFTSPNLSITLEAPRFLDGPYRPEFRYSAPLWSGKQNERLAESLAPGDELLITVDRADLEAATAQLAARQELERRGEIYSPSILGRPGVVDIIALASGDSASGTKISESQLMSAFALILCLSAAAMFGAAGARLLRRPVDFPSSL